MEQTLHFDTCYLGRGTPLFSHVSPPTQDVMQGQLFNVGNPCTYTRDIGQKFLSPRLRRIRHKVCLTWSYLWNRYGIYQRYPTESGCDTRLLFNVRHPGAYIRVTDQNIDQFSLLTRDRAQSVSSLAKIRLSRYYTLIIVSAFEGGLS